MFDSDKLAPEVVERLKQWEPEALLRDPWDGCEKTGWKIEQFVGTEYEIIGGESE